MEDQMNQEKAKVYTRFPASNIAIYNGVTILHYILGGMGIILGYHFVTYGFLLGVIYLIFAFSQMYIIMPLFVCPNCVYYRMRNSVCPSAMNLVSKRIAKEGNQKNFSKRSGGLFSHNKLYMGALIIPIVAVIPALILNFSVILVGIFIGLIVLMVLRIVVIFNKVACVHCAAKHTCPNAIAMGLNK
jgi:fatty-acid desaturase